MILYIKNKCEVELHFQIITIHSLLVFPKWLCRKLAMCQNSSKEQGNNYFGHVVQGNILGNKSSVTYCNNVKYGLGDIFELYLVRYDCVYQIS